MKNTYYVITHTLDGKNYCETLKVSAGMNLMSVLNDYNFWNTVKCVSPCEGKKEAEKLTDFWNKCFKRNGTYALIARGEILVITALANGEAV